MPRCGLESIVVFAEGAFRILGMRRERSLVAARNGGNERGDLLLQTIFSTGGANYRLGFIWKNQFFESGSAIAA